MRRRHLAELELVRIDPAALAKAAGNIAALTGEFLRGLMATEVQRSEVVPSRIRDLRLPRRAVIGEAGANQQDERALRERAVG